MTAKMTHPRQMPDGSMLLIGVSYPRPTNEIESTRPAESGPKVFTYVLLKAGGTWYTSGAGRTPQAAGWGAVEKWLERDGRKLEFIEIVSSTRRIWPAPVEADPDGLLDLIEEFPGRNEDRLAAYDMIRSGELRRADVFDDRTDR